MSCTQWGGDYLEAASQWAFRDAFICPFADDMGMLVFGMCMFGAINMSFYIRQRDLRIPLVLSILVGGAVLPIVAEPITGIVTALFLVASGIVPVLLARRMGA